MVPAGSKVLGGGQGSAATHFPCWALVLLRFLSLVRAGSKVLGGGMRQAGVLAAAGLLSINVMSKVNDIISYNIIVIYYCNNII